tara:strand:+ start:3658 stop:4194 length:537 start_codon:yes stop_codon:yes gene_type:complete
MTPSCRICYGEDGNLLSLCKCSGSLKYVHPECMEKWMQVSKTSRCNICNTHIVKYQKYDEKWMKYADTIWFDHIVAAIIMLIFAFAFKWAIDPISYINKRFKWYYAIEIMSIILILGYLFIYQIKNYFPELEEMFPAFPLYGLDNSSGNGFFIVYNYLHHLVGHHKLSFIKSKMVFQD